MKKLVLVVAMFMFVCGGATFAMAQDLLRLSLQLKKQKHRETTTSEPAKENRKLKNRHKCPG